MNIKYKSLILLAFLLWMAQTQRGGGSRSSSSSRSRSSRRSYRSYYNSPSGNNTNSTQTGQQGQNSDSSNIYVPVLMLSIFGGLGYLGYKQEKKKSKIRSKNIEDLLTEFQGRCESVPCSLGDQKMIQLRDWFMGQNWSIEFSTKDGTFRQTAKLKLEQIKNNQRHTYRLKMSMVDSIGSSSMTGALVHQQDYFAIKFEKTYSNRSQAGQTGLYDLLIYEGAQQGQVFRGQWYYKGFEQSLGYSGAWQMIHK